MKKGLSAVVATLILIMISLAAVAIVWTVVHNLINKNLASAGSCIDVLDKVQVDPLYTCYNSTQNTLQFSLDVGDINIDGILVSVSGAGTSKTFIINSTSTSIQNLVMYPSGSSTILLPRKNEGLTYTYNLTAANLFGGVDRVEVAPIINGEQCSSSDSVQNFPQCDSLV